MTKHGIDLSTRFSGFACALALLSGCSTAPVLSDWLPWGDKSAEVASTPPVTTMAQTDDRDGAVYQSRSVQGKTPASTAGSGTSKEPQSLVPPAGGLKTPAGAGRSFPEGLVPDITQTSGSGVSPFPTLSANVPGTAQPPQFGVYRGMGQGAAKPFRVKTMSGQQFDLAANRGRVVVLDFWRRSCGPCLKAMPKLAQIRSSYPKNQLEIIGVNTDEKLRTARTYLRSNPHDWDQIHARSQSPSLLRLYGVKFLPDFIVIDQIGNIQYRGNDVNLVASKVAELVATPSISQGAGSQTPGLPMASLR